MSHITHQRYTRILSLQNQSLTDRTLDIGAGLNCLSVNIVIVICFTLLALMTAELLRYKVKRDTTAVYNLLKSNTLYFIKEMLWFYLCTLLRGHPGSTKFTSMMIFGTVIFVFVIKNIFTSLMSTNLVVQDDVFIIDTLEDLLDPRAFYQKPLIASLPNMRYWVENSNDMIAKRLKRYFAQIGNDNVYVGIDKVAEAAYDIFNRESDDSLFELFTLVATEKMIALLKNFFCLRKFYDVFQNRLKRTILPYISKHEYFPQLYSLMHNISSAEKLAQFVKL